ncbi:MAG: alpha/beta-hydrolase N-terminal domain-containing protein [Acidimicrobiia bacterium]
MKKQSSELGYFLKIAAPVVIVFSLAFGRIWQNQVRYLIGIEKISLLYTLLAIVASIIFFILFILIGKLANYTGAFLRRRIIKKVPPRLGIVLSLLGTFVIFYFAVTGILFSSFLNVADSIFGTRDHTAPDGISQPQSLIALAVQAR